MTSDFGNTLVGIFGSRSWIDLGLIILAIVIFYSGLRFLLFVLDNLGRPSLINSRIKSVIKYAIDYSEPVFLLIIIAVFFRINPALHSLIVGLLIITGYRQIRDYLTGKAVIYNGVITEDAKIKIGDIIGRVDKLRRFGVQIRSEDALHFFNYTKLYDLGFAVFSSNNFGGIYNLVIDTRQEEVNIDQLRSIIINSPYHHNYSKLKFKEVDLNPNQLSVSVHLRKSTHFQDLKQLLMSKGYNCI